MAHKYERRNIEKEILNALQILGGSATKQAIKEELVSDSSTNLSYADVFEPILSKKGSKYIPFNFDFNFGLVNLHTCGYIQDYTRTSEIVLSEKGRSVKPSQIRDDADLDLVEKYWEKKKKEKESKKEITHIDTKEDIDDVPVEDDDVSDDWKEIVLDKIKHFSPKKFESFSRLLLSKMGIKFDKVKGVKMSGDHGIDGYGYFVSDEFRTARVVVQCKRYSDKPVGEPEIDNFKGVMSSFNAEYGIFVTTSYFTNQAQDKAVQGEKSVTLIDGQKLIELIERYELHIVKSYALEKYYTEED